MPEVPAAPPSSSLKPTAHRVALRLSGMLLIALLLWRWAELDRDISLAPYEAWIPSDDYRQYLAGWSSGVGVDEVVAFLRDAAGRAESPILLVVGGFGRHGGWEVGPRLRNIPNIEVRQAFVDTEKILEELAVEAQSRPVYILEEPPAYEVPRTLLQRLKTPPRTLFTYERNLARLAGPDGALRVLELPAGSWAQTAPAGPPVPVGAPPSVESIINPNGLEGSAGSPFFWVGPRFTDIVIRSGKAGTVKLTGSISAGPSLSGTTTRKVLLRSSTGFEEAVQLTPGEQSFRVPIEAGRTLVQLRALDQPNVFKLPNGDQRPILVGVEHLAVAGWDKEPLRALSCTLQFAEGAYAEERLGPQGSSFRWTNGELRLVLSTSRPGKMKLSGAYISMVRPEEISIFLGERKVATLLVKAEQGSFKPLPSLELDVPAGESTLRWTASKPGKRLPNDSRVLNFGLQNLKLTDGRGKDVCTVQ